LKGSPSITYQAVNKSSDIVSNVAPGSVNAVTWGIFMNHEVIQPTVVDYSAFMIWKDEAFKRWLDWASIYSTEHSQNTLLYIHDNFYLMNVVENDYVDGNLNQTLFEFLLTYREEI